MKFGDMVLKLLAIIPILGSLLIAPIVIFFLAGIFVFMRLFFKKSLRVKQEKPTKHIKKILPWTCEFLTPGNSLIKQTRESHDKPG